MQVGIDSFAAAHDDTTLSVSPSERLRELVEQIERADKLGLDVSGVGEHHRRVRLTFLKLNCFVSFLMVNQIT
jgi:alkanesulfonate monooxygenase SsuD/methylene tetrahydromethanopterin reductase-like flavin-dependent oxidoreductase (luciferase family)